MRSRENWSTKINREELLTLAKEMMAKAYAPYSHFTVGAALLTEDGRVFTGCNVENASYPAGICAERTAMSKAVSEGSRKFTAIAIVGGPEGLIHGITAPCGICRQVMMEFADPERFEILLSPDGERIESHTLKELLPLGFGPSSLT